MNPHARQALMLPLFAAFIATAANAGDLPDETTLQTTCKGACEAGSKSPFPVDPYPLLAAGWGPEVGSGQMASRWAEDWSGVPAAGVAPGLKAMNIASATQLTLSAELRMRQAAFDNGQLARGNDFEQMQLRAVAGADLRVGPHLRLFGEIGSGRVDARSTTATANFQNDVALQQLFLDARGKFGSALAGAMIGRQEFSDGPRQLLSLSDGPNLHRTWNGVRFYVHGERYRVGAFDLRATRLGRGGFDEEVNRAEKLQGLNASFIVSHADAPNTYLDPFWIRSENPVHRVGGRAGLDSRDTIGARLWGRKGSARFDWTVARQSGRTVGDRSVDAWGLFAVQSLTLTDSGWKPRLTSHVDIASGGGTFGSGTVHAFNPLYASSNYLGESQFLGLSNLLMLATGVTVSPTPRTTLSLEYGHAQRLSTRDAVYSSGGRFYAGTQNTSGRVIGGLTRLTGTWAAHANLSLRLNLEHLAAGATLRRTGFSSGTYAYLDATFRY